MIKSATQRKNRLYNRKEIINLLGGICVKCGSIEQLEFDHINPKEKTLNISIYFTMRVLPLIVYKEIKKMQLLCHKCHKDKSIIDVGHQKAVHGTISYHRYHRCRCDLCKEAYNTYRRISYNKKKII